MKIEINNFGPIKTFEYELEKDLNIIFGQNNIGKSYAITVVYLILKNLSENKRIYGNPFYNTRIGFFPFETPLESTEIRKSIESLYNKAREKGEQIEITTIVIELINKILLETLINNLTTSFNNSFSTIDNLSNRLSKKTFSIKVSFNDFEFVIIPKRNKLSLKSIKLKSKYFICHKKDKDTPIHQDKDRVIFTFSSDKKTAISELFENIFGFVFTKLQSELADTIKGVYFLPASRSGLYQALSTFSAVIAELSKSRNFLRNKIELPNISEPVSDYFLQLSNINTNRRNNLYKNIVDDFETNILKGKVKINEETKKIIFEQDNLNFEIDLAFTSSMISEIAPIVAHFKYILRSEFKKSISAKDRIKERKYNLVFIEEPEAHLHPSIQVKLIEIFVALMDLDVKIIMTSHSNYMFNKLSNLILAEKVNYDRIGSYLLRMTEAGSVLDTQSMIADEQGMQDDNFKDIAEELYEQRIKIYEDKNKNAGK